MFDYNDIPADLRSQMEHNETNVLVLSKPDGEPCVKCTATFRALDKSDINYTVSKTISTDEHKNFVLDKIGGMSAPAVIVIDDERNVINAWSDFRRDEIKNIASPRSRSVVAA